MSHDDEEREQLERFHRGKPGAFDDLYAAYGPRLYQFGLRLCGKPADAEDLKQDVFVAAYRNLHRFEGRSSLTTYLYRIAVYRWGQMRASPHPETIGWEETREVSANAAMPDHAHQCHTRIELRAALATLSDVQRAAFLLVKADGFINTEAAKMLNIPIGTVKYRVHEAMVRLRAQLGGEETHPETPRRGKAAKAADARDRRLTPLSAAAQSIVKKEFVRTIVDYSEIFANPDEAESLLGVPVLGFIPMISEPGLRLLSDVSTFSPLVESYRTLRTLLRFRKDTPLRTLVVTSAIPGDGKSTTVANLAIAIAKAKKRVIIVDADLRRPTQHKLFQMDDAPGLTDVLAGTHSVDQVLRPTGVDGVFLISAGALISAGGSAHRSPELLESEAMEQLLNELKQQSDMVLLDTPPVLPVIDACAFTHATDGVLLVIGAGETRKAHAQKSLEVLRRCRAEVLGTVFNRIPMGTAYYYGKYYVPAEELTAQVSSKEAQIGPDAEAAPDTRTVISHRRKRSA